MKNIFILTFLFSLFVSNAQTLNDKGLYIDMNGNLYTGLITSTNNDIKAELEVKEGVIAGTANYYFASGKLMESGMLANGLKDGKWIRYTETGLTSAIGFYAAGKKSGEWTIFDEKGNKRMEMYYNNGEKTGTWNSWDENGVLANTKVYGQAN